MALNSFLQVSLCSTMPLFLARTYSETQNLCRWILYTCFQKQRLCGLPAKTFNFSVLFKAKPAGALLRPPLPFSRALFANLAPAKEIEYRDKGRELGLQPQAPACHGSSHTPPHAQKRGALLRAARLCLASGLRRSWALNCIVKVVLFNAVPRLSHLSDARALHWDVLPTKIHIIAPGKSFACAWLLQIFGVGRNQPKELQLIQPKLCTLPAPRESARKKPHLPRTLASREFQSKKGFALCPIH